MKNNYYVKPYEYNAFADIVISDHQDYKAWNANNYIQVFVTELNNKTKDIYIDYLSGSVYGCIPILKIEDLSPDKINNPQQVYDRIKLGLSQGYVYYTFLNHSYIPFYSKDLFDYEEHDVLINSKNSNEIKYIENLKGEYELYEVNEEKIKESFLNCNNNCVFELKSDKNMRYKFNLDSFIKMLYEYLNSKEPKDESVYFHKNGFYSENFFGEKKSSALAYGIDSYSYIVEYVIKNINQKRNIDYRMFYLLKEHKHNMIDKISYLVQHNYIHKDKAEKLMEQFKNLENRLNTIMHIVMKYNYKLTSNVVDRVVGEIDILVKEDKKAFYDLYISLS